MAAVGESKPASPGAAFAGNRNRGYEPIAPPLESPTALLEGLRNGEEESTVEKSCGAVVFTRVCGEIRYLLVQSVNGHYGFPKGHREQRETELETAEREVLEETGLRVRFIPGFRESCVYNIPGTDISKEVVFFLGEFANQVYSFQKEEISGGCLVNLEEANQLLPFGDVRRILLEANGFLTAK